MKKETVSKQQNLSLTSFSSALPGAEFISESHMLYFSNLQEVDTSLRTERS